MIATTDNTYSREMRSQFDSSMSTYIQVLICICAFQCKHLQAEWPKRPIEKECVRRNEIVQGGSIKLYFPPGFTSVHSRVYSVGCNQLWSDALHPVCTLKCWFLKQVIVMGWHAYEIHLSVWKRQEPSSLWVSAASLLLLCCLNVGCLTSALFSTEFIPLRELTLPH